MTDEQPSTVEAPSAEQQEELQEQNKQEERRREQYSAELRKSCADGIDTYFDNFA